MELALPCHKNILWARRGVSTFSFKEQKKRSATCPLLVKEVLNCPWAETTSAAISFLQKWFSNSHIFGKIGTLAACGQSIFLISTATEFVVVYLVGSEDVHILQVYKQYNHVLTICSACSACYDYGYGYDYDYNYGYDLLVPVPFILSLLKEQPA